MVTNGESRRLLEVMERSAREEGLEIITKVIHFTNNDVPEFLKRLKEFENKSKEAKVRMRYQIPSPAY